MADETLTPDGLLKELREAVKSGKGNYGHRLLCGQAADEIERLRAELREVCPGRDATHTWLRDRERYGDDADGNRGEWRYFVKCTDCGEERRE